MLIIESMKNKKIVRSQLTNLDNFITTSYVNNMSFFCDYQDIFLFSFLIYQQLLDFPYHGSWLIY